MVVVREIEILGNQHTADCIVKIGVNYDSTKHRLLRFNRNGRLLDNGAVNVHKNVSLRQLKYQFKISRVRGLQTLR